MFKAHIPLLINGKILRRNQLPKLELILNGFESSSDLPGYLRIQIVDFCNEECFFCHNEGSEVESKGKLIDEQVMWKAINASINLGKNKFKFTGGEPTLHPKFSYYIMNLRKKVPNANIGFTSNGTSLNKLPKEVFTHGIDKLTISLHSLERYKYKEITKKDYLNRVLEGLDLVRSYDFSNISLNIVIGSSNLDDINSIIKYSNEKNFKVRILDILGNEENYISTLELQKEIERVTKYNPKLREIVELKPKLYHTKCEGCLSRNICGEGEYLRLNVNNKLISCLYRSDLEQNLYSNDDDEIFTRKIALGFRRIHFDNL